MPTLAKRLPPAEYLRERLDYNPDTGGFIWKAKPPIDRENKRWNSCWVGRRAGGLNPASGYLLMRIDSVTYMAHHVAWKMVYGEQPPVCIDHIDGDRANVRISNLRAATLSENRFNQPKYRSNKVGYKGVFMTRNKYRSQIQAYGKTYHLGYYQTAEEAHAAYCAAAKRLHGEFAHD